MNKLFLILVCMTFLFHSGAQTWNREIQRLSGKPKLKTIKINTGMYTTVGTRLEDSDSVKITRFFDGNFLSGSHDSLSMKLVQVRLTKNYTSGVKQSFVIPARQYSVSDYTDTNFMRIPVSGIHYLDYYNKKWRDRAEGSEVVLFGSLLVMVLSPFICFKYSEGHMNTGMYKNWALGSTIGIVAGFTTMITIDSFSKHKTFEFKPGWSGKKNARVWKFN